MASSSAKQPPLLDVFRRDGYVKVPNLLPRRLLLASQAASKYQTERARNGKWPCVRTVPKQYPPWELWQPGDNIWGVQHLLHPDMPVRDVFAEVYFSDEVLNVVKELIGLETEDSTDDQLVMELFNLLVSPAQNQDFELCWHRDDIRPEISPGAEAEELAKKNPNGQQLHAQYNIALFDDASLVVVPGSHNRVRTDAERNADPFAVRLPGQVIVDLNPGDAVFYNSNILHRGVYTGVDTSEELGRMTLHGSVGLAGHDSERARQVLQHSVGEWVDRAEFTSLDTKTNRAEGMRKRLVAMGSASASASGLGYSLTG